MTEINNTLLTSLIKGLKYNSKTDEYTFNHKKYKLREVKETESKQDITHYYFVNINEPVDVVLVKGIKGIPTYDGFNDVKVDTQLRKIAYQREYYRKVTLEKRAKASEKLKAERQKAKEQLKQQKQKLKEKEKAKKLAKIKPKVCKFCGAEFKPKAKIQKFCSHECQLKYNSKKQAQKKKESNHVEKVCPICNKTFTGTTKNTYCSKECYKVSQKQDRRQRYEKEKELGYYSVGGKYHYKSNK